MEKILLHRYDPTVGNYLHLKHEKFHTKNFPRVNRGYVCIPGTDLVLYILNYCSFLRKVRPTCTCLCYSGRICLHMVEFSC